MTGVRVERSDGGVSFALTLDRVGLLPGRAAGGSVKLTFQGSRSVRGIVASLIATEHWQYRETRHDANGRTSTRTVTREEELRRLPVQLAGPGEHAAGSTVEFPLELPVPPLGPATLDASVAGVSWRLEVKCDVPGFDASIEQDVVVLQPTALLRAGVIDVAQFALWPNADAAADGSRASIALDPVPLCIGSPFGGLLSIATGPTNLQEIRLELRSKVEATVASGLEEEITLWAGRVAGAGEFGGAEHAIAFDSSLPARWLPTVRLPHGRADAQFHVILAKAWAPDTHLVRDVAICSTTEI